MERINIKRGEKITKEQKETLVLFMEENKEFACCKMLSPEGRIKSYELWTLLMEALNSSGPRKSLVKWQRVWTDLKMKVKRKAGSIRRNSGINSSNTAALTDLDKRILAVISQECETNLTGTKLENETPSYIQPSVGTSAIQSWVTVEDSSEEICTRTTSDTASNSSFISVESNSDGELEQGPISRGMTKRRQELGAISKEVLTLSRDMNNHVIEIKEKMDRLVTQQGRIANALERIADVLEKK